MKFRDGSFAPLKDREYFMNLLNNFSSEHMDSSFEDMLIDLSNIRESAMRNFVGDDILEFIDDLEGDIQRGEKPNLDHTGVDDKIYMSHLAHKLSKGSSVSQSIINSLLSKDKAYKMGIFNQIVDRLKISNQDHIVKLLLLKGGEFDEVSNFFLANGIRDSEYAAKVLIGDSSHLTDLTNEILMSRLDEGDIKKVLNAHS